MNSWNTPVHRRTVLANGAAVASAAAMSGCTPHLSRRGPADRFVRVDGTRLTRGGEAYRYTGANAWYLAWLGSDTKYGDRARLRRELDRLQDLGVGNIRVLAGAEESPVRNSIKPGFEKRDGTLNSALLEGLDLALAEMGLRGMTAVMYFTNNWEWSGGMMSRLYWQTGQYIDMGDPAAPWPAFPDAGTAFYANEQVVERFFSYVRFLVTRTNSVTGMRYADDPTVMSWQLANEPRPGVSPDVMTAILPAYYKWIADSAALIRSLDPNHLVSLGMEGTIATNGSADIVLRAHRDVDYMTAYLAPQLGLGGRQKPAGHMGGGQGQGPRLPWHAHPIG